MDRPSRGSLRWAIRDSFLRYVTVIAAGRVQVDGVERDGEGRFVFPLRAVGREGDDWHLSFGGSVRFTAHNGFLDVLVAAPEVLIGPGGGVLATHRREDEASLTPLVELDPGEPEFDGDSAVWPSIATRLLEAGAEQFGGAYQAGADLAPIAMRMERRRPVD
ncbi:HtaA domain-containing protein [Leucobacter weissii]|uniref:HtaA domain-containing protein n=1 Tax=Leucobacter weissii TaxID=1983706 RepID=A0A939MJV7_9MICO|nr:HtaA domain-containing protein [Leucobacter weissii]MBO1901320.1 HtaA domain-containing protein [Leucobacter weissii]